MRVHWTIPCALLVVAAVAKASPFEATLTFQISGEELHFVGSGNGYNTPAFVTLPDGTLTGMANATIYSPVSGISVSLAPGGSGAFSGAPLAGPMPLRGVIRLKSQGGTVAVVPLNSGYDLEAFGVGGEEGVTIWTDRSLQVFFEPWTAGMATVRGAATMYTGSDARTPGGRGQITLVSPAKISYGKDLHVVLLGTLRVDFVPEPHAPLLLATGAALLCALGRRRRGEGPRGLAIRPG